MLIYCPTDLPEFQQNICAGSASRIISAAIMRLDHGIDDFEDAAQWEAAEAAGTVTILRATRGEETEGTPIEIDGFGREKTRFVGMDHILNFELPYTPQPAGGVSQTEFFNSLNKSSDRLIAWYTSGGLGFVEDAAVINAMFKRTTPMVLEDITKWIGTIGWTSQDLADEVALPAAYFDC